MCVAWLGGCRDTDPSRGLLDPTAVGRFQKTPLLVSVVSNLDPSIEEPREEFASATDVRPQDLEVQAQDYVIGPNDYLSVTISDLQAPGTETTKPMRVSESGYISLPMIGAFKAAGLTEAQLEQGITRAYQEARIITNTNVSVVVSEARARTFSILGAVGAAGVYPMFKADFRILDALTAARDTTAQEIEYLYVIRPLGETLPTSQPAPGAAMPATQPATDVLAPQSRAGGPTMPVLLDAAGTTAPAAADSEGHYVTVDGRQVLVNPRGTTLEAAPAPAPTAAPAASTAPFQFNEPAGGLNQRVIRVPLEKLRSGDLRYNIVIRPHDMILVPPPVTGEYYMGGHVARVGVYSLTARRITLTQAIVSAGMFDQLAIPSQTEIRRRIGPNSEEIALVNLDKVWAGEQPNIYLKPNDIVNVGTNALAPFLAAARGAFRMTYGFGFLYDRNFANADNRTNSTGG
jgi:protein involved in polysaccharide export with SLBB domain